MKRNQIYYSLKPILPSPLRTALRRAMVRKKRREYQELWPINEKGGGRPEGWPGWPNGKKFAIVLTHDIEGASGLARCRDLMSLEKDLGFRSSFNFIPEGDYDVLPELRNELTTAGFEVGVHDLNHDGKLYASRKEFFTRAKRINRYLKEWNATGFRSGFMLHNLGWLGGLDIAYDASTFDNDPFEPQPDGVNTIFPFWVPGLNGSGYVELPYTLAQDSTLFVYLEETSIEIWKRKLDWVVSHGGMVLLNTHPDYMTFDSRQPSAREFPSRFYREILEYVKTKYPGEYWHALPKDVAHWYKSTVVQNSSVKLNSPAVPTTISPSGKQKPHGRILMLLENHYPQDTRVRNEATFLHGCGYDLTVICYRKGSQPYREVVNGVHVYRVPRIDIFKKTPLENPNWIQTALLRVKSFMGYLMEYGYFTSACFLLSSWVWLKKGFDAIHAHNPPDTLFLAALPFKFLGKKFVFDHHDLCPELYRSRYGAKEGFQTKLLGFFEWCSLKVANATIATNESYKQAQIQRAGRKPETIFIVRNGPNQDRMSMPVPNQRLRCMNRKILCYIGSLNPQDGVDYLLRALGHLLHDLKREDFFCVIMGSGDSLEDLRALSTQLRLDAHVELTGFISDKDLLENLAAADICVDPDPSSPLNDVSTWIKIMEYMAFAKPIVSFDLKETRYSAQDAAIFVPPNDEMAFAKGVAKLMDDPLLREKMGRFGRERVEKELQWNVVSKNLLATYRSIL